MKKPKAPRPWVDPPEVPERNRLPPGWEPAKFITMDDVPDAQASAARQNSARHARALQDAAFKVLVKSPGIRTGPALRAAMEREPDTAGTLKFSDPASVDRLLAGIINIYKLGRKAK